MQELELYHFSWEHATAQQANSLFTVLASLPSLDSVMLSVQLENTSHLDDDRLSNLHLVSILTNIR